MIWTTLPAWNKSTAISIEDKYKLTFKNTAVKYWWMDHNNFRLSYFANRYRLYRYYAHDRFSVKKDWEYLGSDDVGGLININNGTDYKLYKTESLGHAIVSHETWMVHWSNWKNLPFSKLHSLTVANLFMNRHAYEQETDSIADSSTLFIEHQSTPKNFIVDTDKYMEFLLHTEYKFENWESNEVDKDLGAGINDHKPIIRPIATKTDYLSEGSKDHNLMKLFVYFPKVDQLKNNRNIIYLFGMGIEFNDIFAKEQINAKGNYIETPYGKLGLTYVNMASDDRDPWETKGGEPLNFMGVFRVDDYVKYNYIKKQAEKNMSHGSSRGLLIPYNFYGEWNMKMHLSLNDVYKDLTLNVHQHIDKPVLDPYIGQVRLKIANSDLVAPEFLDKSMGEIKSSYFKDIIENFNSIYALDRRYSIEKN